MAKSIKISKYGKATLAIIGTSTAIDVAATGGVGSALLSLGLSSSLIESLKGTIGGGFAGLLTNQFLKFGEGFGKGGDVAVEKSFEKALANALEEVRSDFFSNQDYKATLKQKITRSLGGIPSDSIIKRDTLDRHFFTPLFEAFQVEDTIKRILRNTTHIRPAEMVRKIVETSGIILPEIERYQQEELIRVLSESFNDRFLIHFHNQLRADQNAQKVYYTNLLHGLIIGNEEILKDQKSIQEEIDKLVDFARWKGIELNRLLNLQQGILQRLDRQRKEFQDHKKTFEESRELILDVYKERKSDPSSQFKYESLFTKFVGRANELDFFLNFLESNEKFAWTMLSGPGGAGKSRLANEICLKAENLNWISGFARVEHNTFFSWENYSFPTNVLIVFDYVQSRLNEVQRIIDILCTRLNTQTLSCKVRVLLLERQFDPIFQNKIFNRHIRAKETFFGNYQEPLRLGELEEDFRWQIILQTIGGTANEQEITKKKSEILLQLDKQDPNKRPLFAFFSGVALADGQSIDNWNTKDNLQYHIERQEEKFWSRNQIWKQYSKDIKDVIWLASICEWLSYEDLLRLSNHDRQLIRLEPDSLSEDQFQELKNIFQFNAQGLNHEGEFAGIKPDLLAEYFLVHHLDLMQKDVRRKMKINALIQLAWEISFKRSAGMIYLTYQNFQDHSGIGPLLTWINEGNPNQDAASIEHYGLLLNSLGVIHHNSDQNMAAKYYQKAVEKGYPIAMFNLGLICEINGDNELAKKHYLMAAEMDYASAIYRLGENYEHERNFQLAEKYYLRAIDLGHVNAGFVLAVLYSDLGRNEEAERYYKMAVDNGHVDAMFNLAIYYKSINKYSLSEKYYMRAVEKGDINSMFNLANHFWKTGFKETSQKYFEMAINRGDLDSSVRLAFYFEEDKKFYQAEKYYLLGVENNHTLSMRALAHMYENQERLETAEYYYNMAVDLKDSEAMRQLGLMKQNQGDFESAEQYFLMSLENGCEESSYELGLLYKGLEDNYKAEKYFLKAIENGDDFALCQLGLIYQAQKKYDLAEKYFNKARDDQNSDAEYYLGCLYKIQGKIDMAIEYYLKSVEEDKSYAMWDLSSLYHDQGNSELAEKYCEMAVDAERLIQKEAQNWTSHDDLTATQMNILSRKDALEDPFTIIELALAYDNNGDLKKAEEYYQLAIEKEGYDALGHLATVYKKLGELKAAEKYYLMAIDHKQESALNNLAILYRELEKWDLAEKYYLLAHDSGSEQALYNLANALQAKGDLTNAEKYYKIAAENGIPGSMNNLALIYKNNREFELAEKYFLMAIATDHVIAMDNLGCMYMDNEQLDLAEKYFLMAVEAEHIKSMYNLSVLYLLKNEHKNFAWRLIENVLAVDQDDLPAKMYQLIISLWIGRHDWFFENCQAIISLILNNKPNLIKLFIRELTFHDHSNKMKKLIDENEFSTHLKEKLGVLFPVIDYFSNIENNQVQALADKQISEYNELISKIEEKRKFYRQ